MYGTVEHIDASFRRVLRGKCVSAAHTAVACRLKCRVTNMRKKPRVLALATLIAAAAVPVGFALSVDPRADSPSAGRELVPATQVVASHTPLLATTTAAVNGLPDVPEGAKLLVIGGVLFAVAAAMRRTTGETRQ